MHIPDSKAHGANMWPIWGRQDPGGSRADPMSLAIWDGSRFDVFSWHLTHTSLQMKRPWMKWVAKSYYFIKRYTMTKTKQFITKPCAYWLGSKLRKESHERLHHRTYRWLISQNCDTIHGPVIPSIYCSIDLIIFVRRIFTHNFSTGMNVLPAEWTN